MAVEKNSKADLFIDESSWRSLAITFISCAYGRMENVILKVGLQHS